MHINEVYVCSVSNQTSNR